MDLRNYICIYQKTLDIKSNVCYNYTMITITRTIYLYDYI